MKGRIAYLLQVFGWTVLVFLLAKIFFMLFNHEGHPFTAADVWSVITHGFTLDLSTSLYILSVPFLATIIGLWLGGIPKAATVMRWLMCGWFIVVAIALSLAFVADTSLYPFWGFKLESSCLQYLETPTEAMASVSTGYLIVRFLVWALVAYLIFKGYPKFRLRLASKKLLRTVCYLLLLPVLIIGIRGGLTESTTNIGQVYFSQNQFLNHSAVNPVFSFLASFERTASEIVSYDFMDEATCAQTLKGCYSTESIMTDTLLKTQRPNIVLILMESASEVFAEAMPRLQQLKKEGITFTNCYGNTYRTDRGTVCTLSGYPSFPTMSVMKIPKKAAGLPSIARSLQQKGYATSYLYGGDINFTNMKSYLIATGWEKLHWKADYTIKEQNSAKWGVRDDITFQTLYNQIKEADTTKPFLIGYSTLSSHEPWDVPTNELADEKMNAFNYLDKCIGDFVDRLKVTPQWENLLIVLLPDHGINYKQIDETDQIRNHIPLVWIGGAVKAPRTITQVCNQSDLAATLLGQMGISHEAFTYSRDVLSANYQKPFAMHCYNNGFSVVDSTSFTVFDLTSEKTIAGSNSKAVALGKAILQATSKDLKNKQ